MLKVWLEKSLLLLLEIAVCNFELCFIILKFENQNRIKEGVFFVNLIALLYHGMYLLIKVYF